MSKVSQVLKALEFQIRVKSDFKPVILDDIPATPRLNEVYIIAPAVNSITINPMISTDSWEDYTIQIYAIAHVINMNRMVDVNEDINRALVDAETKLRDVFGRDSRLIYNAVIDDIEFGTETWVTDTKIFTACTMKFSMTDYLEDNFL